MAHSIPTDRKYTKDHEWAKDEGDGRVRIGVTSYAVEQLGDVTLIDLPSTGGEATAHEHFGDIESVKTVSELFAPVSGEVVEINDELEDQPELINDAPYEGGWIVLIEMSAPGEFDSLMDAADYEQLISNLDE